MHLPDCVHEDITDHYAAHASSIAATATDLQHRRDDVGTRSKPRQCTTIPGMWCVEGVVWDGQHSEITQFELLERDGDRYRFRAAGGMHAGPGSAGSLIPPHEYHTIGNPNADEVAVNVPHIYKAPMDYCSKFIHAGMANGICANFDNPIGDRQGRLSAFAFSR